MKKKNLTSLNELLDKEYGPLGTSEREKYEREYQDFKIGVLLQESRKEAHLTQEELATRINTKKTYISRLENNNTDLRFSTLKRIVEDGLGGKLIIKIELPNQEKIKM